MLTNEQINLIWAGVPYDPTGYGTEARGFIGMLDQYRLNLKIIPQSFHQGEDSLTPEQKIRFAELERAVVHPGQAIVVQHFPANLFNEQFRGRINIGRTMFETNRIPWDWAGQCNRMDEIWVPCHYNVDTFAGSGVLRQKLRVVPGGVDVNVFHPAAPPLEPKQKGFVFLSVFGWFDHKGWDLLLTAYCTEFRPEEDVMLVIKTLDYMHHSHSNRAADRQLYQFFANTGGGNPGATHHQPQYSQQSNARSVYRMRCLCPAVPRRGLGTPLPGSHGLRAAGHRYEMERQPGVHER